MQDHHCIWINNCVGHENYKIFLVFVLYAVVASLYSLVLQYPWFILAAIPC